MSAMLFSVQFGNLGEGFLPGAGKTTDVRIKRPTQPSGMVDSNSPLNLKAGQWPRGTSKAFSILATSLATDFPTGCIVATGLAGVLDMADCVRLQFIRHGLAVLQAL
jgi:hypothetical protein